jgi:outer membrane protein assembly factor BamB
MNGASKIEASRRVLAAVLCLFATVGAAQIAQGGSRRPTLLWKFATSPNDDWVLHLAVGRTGTVYAGTWVGNTNYAIGSDGALGRKLTVEGKGISRLAVGNDGTIYAGSDFVIYAFDPGGALKWKTPVVGALVAGDDGTMYAVVRYLNGEVYTIAPDGALMRKFVAGSPRITQLAVVNAGTFYSGGVTSPRLPPTALLTLIRK